MKTAEQIIREAKITGQVLKLNSGELDYGKEYVPVKNKLKLIGGEWKSGKNGFVFPDGVDVPKLVEQLLVETNDGVNLKKKFQFFHTPPDLGAEMVSHIKPEKGMKLGETSAGQGHLVKEVFKKWDHMKTIYCWEIMDTNREYLTKIPGVVMAGHDFLKDGNEHLGTFDVIYANPPFSNNQDIDHVTRMWKMLKPGGAMVTMLGPSWKTGSQRKQVTFKEWLDEVGALLFKVDAGRFKASGTQIASWYAIIRKESVTEKQQEKEIANLISLY